jgi:putative transposase
MFALLCSLLVQRGSIREIALENLALRQQLVVFKRRCPRPRLRWADRLFWLCLSRTWKNWRPALIIVRPETVVSWHRKGFRLFWAWVSRRKCSGRPETSPEIRALVRKLAAANPLWEAPRIHGELLKLGIPISERSVSRLLPKKAKLPSQAWKAFLDNHADHLVAMDFFTVPTATFRVLFGLVILAHRRRSIVHFNVTEHPTAAWVAQQLREAFPEDGAPRYLIRDRDRAYGAIPGPRRRNGHHRSADRSAEPVAECVRGKINRLYSVGMPGPRDRPGREAPAEDSTQLLRILPRIADPFVAG